MRERGIPFSGPMVRAILEGWKTQTRRVVKLLPGCGVGAYTTDGDDRPHEYVVSEPDGDPGETLRCPYGVPGDRLWVREAWCTADRIDHLSGSEIAKHATDAGYDRPWAPLEYADGKRVNWEHGHTPGRYRHARFMPRWASRITLDLTDVRVERVQDISEADAVAEGVRCGEDRYVDGALQDAHGWYVPPMDNRYNAPTHAYRVLWDSINGAEAWDLNPWVWALTFRVLP